MQDDQSLWSIKRFSADNMKAPMEIHNVIASSLEEAVQKIRKNNRSIEMEKDQIRTEEAQVAKMDQVEHVEKVTETQTERTRKMSDETICENQRKDEVEALKE